MSQYKGLNMKVMRLTKGIKFFGFGVFLAAHSLAFAEPSSSEAAVPVKHASFHQLVFSDEDIAILNNFFPPNGDSGFHTHCRDLVSVIIQPSQTSGQVLGKPFIAAPMNPAGAAFYGTVGAPLTHRVVNGGKSAYQIIVVELRRSKPLGNAVSSRDAASQYLQIFDNSRMRAWRLVLTPGQTVPVITQGNKGIRVVVRGGLLTTISSDLPNQDLVLRPGDFAVQPAGAKRALKNSGTETIELVEMELK